MFHVIELKIKFRKIMLDRRCGTALVTKGSSNGAKTFLKAQLQKKHLHAHV